MKGMLMEFIRIEGFGFSLVNSDIYLINLMNKYEVNFLY